MAIANAASVVEVKAFTKGAVLFKQGEAADAAYILNAGAVGLYRESQNRRVPLATVRQG